MSTELNKWTFIQILGHMEIKPNWNNPNSQRKIMFCEYCPKHGPTRDTFCEIHTKPVNWKPRQNKS